MNIPHGSRGIIMATAHFTEEQKWGREWGYRSNRDKQVQELLKPFRYFGKQDSSCFLWSPEKGQVDVAHVFYEQNNSIGGYGLDALVCAGEVHQYEEGDFDPKEVTEEIFQNLVFRRDTVEDSTTAMAYLVGDLGFREAVLNIVGESQISPNITSHENNQVLVIQWDTRAQVVNLYEQLYPDNAEQAQVFANIWRG